MTDAHPEHAPEAPSGLGGVVDLSAEELDGLAAATTFLSRLLLAAPGDDVLDGTRDPALLADWPLPPSEVTSRGLELLAASAERGEDARVIKRDHARLFVGPDTLLAPPYESVHRSTDGLVFEKETMQVRAFYARFDLAAPRAGRDPDDHIGLELAFVAALATRALDALEAGDEAERARILDALREFLDDHLLVWGPDLMVMIGESADTAFYQGVSALGFGTLEHLAGRVFGRALRP
ncbi:MAG: TorD/DmsD family molecular chaperone [Actinomycetota bacterium]